MIALLNGIFDFAKSPWLNVMPKFRINNQTIGKTDIGNDKNIATYLNYELIHRHNFSVLYFAVSIYISKSLYTE